MTNQIAVLSDVDTDVRWREWQAKGAASDRRTAARMRLLMFFIIAALAVWSYIQLG